jgi:hypothetical protein
LQPVDSICTIRAALKDPRGEGAHEASTDAAPTAGRPSSRAATYVSMVGLGSSIDLLAWFVEQQKASAGTDDGSTSVTSIFGKSTDKKKGSASQPPVLGQPQSPAMKCHEESLHLMLDAALPMAMLLRDAGECIDGYTSLVLARDRDMPNRNASPPHEVGSETAGYVRSALPSNTNITPNLDTPVTSIQDQVVGWDVVAPLCASRGEPAVSVQCIMLPALASSSIPSNHLHSSSTWQIEDFAAHLLLRYTGFLSAKVVERLGTQMAPMSVTTTVTSAPSTASELIHPLQNASFSFPAPPPITVAEVDESPPSTSVINHPLSKSHCSSTSSLQAQAMSGNAVVTAAHKLSPPAPFGRTKSASLASFTTVGAAGCDPVLPPQHQKSTPHNHHHATNLSAATVSARRSKGTVAANSVVLDEYRRVMQWKENNLLLWLIAQFRDNERPSLIGASSAVL